MTETYWNPSSLIAPAFRAGLRMANPPGQGATAYPAEWRQGAEGLGRNYRDAFALPPASAHTRRSSSPARSPARIPITRHHRAADSLTAARTPSFTPSSIARFLDGQCPLFQASWERRQVNLSAIFTCQPDFSMSPKPATFQMHLRGGKPVRDFAPQIRLSFRLAISLMGR